MGWFESTPCGPARIFSKAVSLRSQLGHTSGFRAILSRDTQRRDSISPGLVPDPACVSFTT